METAKSILTVLGMILFAAAFFGLMIISINLWSIAGIIAILLFFIIVLRSE